MLLLDASKAKVLEGWGKGGLAIMKASHASKTESLIKEQAVFPDNSQVPAFALKGRSTLLPTTLKLMLQGGGGRGGCGQTSAPVLAPHDAHMSRFRGWLGRFPHLSQDSR